MDMILPLVLSLIFIGLGLIHFNWALGGKFGFEKALPTTETGERVMNPTKLASGIVGTALIAFGLFYVLRPALTSLDLPHWVLNYGGWAIPAIFLLRAIGDFKYIGFFKRIRQTGFGRLDTAFYSPLCLLIGVVGVIVQLSE